MPPKRRAKSYLIITNISKRKNVKSLLLEAAAFGCSEIFVAGQKKFEFDPDAADGTDVPPQLGHHLRSGAMAITRFDGIEECVAHIRSMAGGGDLPGPVRIVGVEIDDGAIDVEDEPFEGDTAFMMGNEGQGMNERQMNVCDGFVRIAQYGGGTASLNVSVAAGIVLHRFHHWSMSEG